MDPPFASFKILLDVLGKKVHVYDNTSYFNIFALSFFHKSINHSIEEMR
mgnify:CR=1 FL=1